MKLARLDLMCKQYQWGFSAMQISKFWGIGEHRTNELLKAAGIEMRPRGAYWKKGIPQRKRK
jgi:hypothetical protein